MGRRGTAEHVQPTPLSRPLNFLPTQVFNTLLASCGWALLLVASCSRLPPLFGVGVPVQEGVVISIFRGSSVWVCVWQKHRRGGGKFAGPKSCPWFCRCPVWLAPWLWDFRMWNFLSLLSGLSFPYILPPGPSWRGHRAQTGGASGARRGLFWGVVRRAGVVLPKAPPPSSVKLLCSPVAQRAPQFFVDQLFSLYLPPLS